MENSSTIRLASIEASRSTEHGSDNFLPDARTASLLQRQHQERGRQLQPCQICETTMYRVSPWPTRAA